MDVLEMVNKQQYAEVRDYFHKELEKVEEQRQDLLKNHLGDHKALDAVMNVYSDVLRMYDRYYVLADMKAKGLDVTKRGW